MTRPQGLVSQALEAELRDEVRRNGIVVWVLPTGFTVADSRKTPVAWGDNTVRIAPNCYHRSS